MYVCKSIRTYVHTYVITSILKIDGGLGVDLDCLILQGVLGRSLGMVGRGHVLVADLSRVACGIRSQA